VSNDPSGITDLSEIRDKPEGLR
jgi:hypothetical protein